MMLRLTFKRSVNSAEETREIKSITDPITAREAVDEWERLVRNASKNGQELISVTFRGEVEPVVIDLQEVTKIEWEYIP